MKKYIFSDFDGTLTLNGQMSAVFFELLDILKKKNLELVIVSGRSVSWGHFLLTHLPLNHVIMEGGGVISTALNHEEISDQVLVEESLLQHLSNTTIELRKNSQIKFSADSFGRLTDRAVEYKLMQPEALKSLEQILQSKNLNYSYSNVHLNYWAGFVSKFKAVEKFCKEKNIKYKDCYYFGDARNDESMFEHFPKSVGVSNIAQFLPQMKFHPTTILKGKENEEINGVVNFLKNLA